jgi:hypothetical protein
VATPSQSRKSFLVLFFKKEHSSSTLPSASARYVWRLRGEGGRRNNSHQFFSLGMTP